MESKKWYEDARNNFVVVVLCLAWMANINLYEASSKWMAVVVLPVMLLALVTNARYFVDNLIKELKEKNNSSN